MAKAVSTLVSITLLVVADRAAAYWQRTHPHAIASESRPAGIQREGHELAPTTRVIPTNITPDTHTTIIPL